MKKLEKDQFVGSGRYDWYSGLFDNAERLGHKSWIEGSIPVHPWVKRLYDEFKFKNPTTIPRVDKQASYRVDGEYIGLREIAIAFADAPDIACGTIFVQTDSTTNELMYGVESERIRNNRYKPHNEDYFRKRTKDFKKAKQVVLESIKPVGFSELETRYKRAAALAQSSINERATDKLRMLSDIGWRDFVAEVRHMVAVGYRPTTPEMQKAVAFMAEQGQETEREANYKPMTCFVWALPDRIIYRVQDAEPLVAHSLEEIPEQIRDKLSVLQLAGKSSPIVDVGVRVDDTKFWVFL